MTDDINRQILLASRPDGVPTAANFRLNESPVPEPGDGEAVATETPAGVVPEGAVLEIDPVVEVIGHYASFFAPSLTRGSISV